MALPKEPRQKMINIMYLVLTALLALNVSAEILNAFKTVDRSLVSTNSTINSSTGTIMSSLADKQSEPGSADKARLWYPKAKQAVDLTAAMNSYIDGLKNELLRQSGFDPNKENSFDSSFKEDNIDIPTHLLVDGGKGKELRDKLAAYKQQLLGIDPLIKQQFENSLQINLNPPPVKDASNSTWERAYFHMVPTVAALTMLSKFQNDVKTSENRVVAFCHEQVGKVVVRFDTYAAVIGQSSNYVMPGQEIEITAGVGAFSKQAQPTISIGGQGAPLGEDGAAHLKIPAGGQGVHSVPVNITYTDQEGKKQTISKTLEYTVGQANASIALDKMNVLYVGVDNPVTIAASGGGDDRVQATISGGNGSLSKAGAGKYIARVGTVTEDCNITVSVDGRVAGQQRFRVRTVPQANAFVGGYISGSNVPANTFKEQTGVGAGIKDFPFELSYQVVSFSVTCDNEEGDVEEQACQGNTWSGPARAMLQRNVKNGRTVTIDNIRVKGPDGTVKPSAGGSLVYYIK